MKLLKGREAEWELPSGGDIPEFEINMVGNWKMLIAMLLLGISLAYVVVVIASSRGLQIPGIATREIVREIRIPVIKTITVTKEVPVEKIIEKPVYINRPVEKPVYINRTVQIPVPVQPQRIWVDAPRNIPGCFPIFIHLSYGNGVLRSYGTTICGRW